MASYLVTGASRGLGLEMVGFLAVKPPSEVSIIFGTLRSLPPKHLQDIVSKSNSRVVLVHLEATDADSATLCRGPGQVLPQRSRSRRADQTMPRSAQRHRKGIMTTTTLRETPDVNVVAVRNSTLACLPLLRVGELKTVLNMSSIVGSLTQAEKWAFITPHHAYKISKAALNSLTRLYALDMGIQGFTIFAVPPGWVKTDQGGPYADLDAGTSDKAVLDLLRRDRAELNGKFLKKTAGLYKYDGAEIPC